MTKLLKPAPNAVLLLADGTVFSGYGVGAAGETAGEICFNTAMTGYQEILTDPSYTGQIITFTFPHIGNVGTNAEDIEAQTSSVSGLILRENITEPSNFRAAHHLNKWLGARASASHLQHRYARVDAPHPRERRAQNCAIAFKQGATREELIKKANAALEQAPDMNGLELAAHVTTKANHPWSQQRWALGKWLQRTTR